MSNEQSILELGSLLMEAAALSEALLEGDPQESRFRADLIAGNARRLGISAAHTAALAVVDRLGAADDFPKNGYARALQDLSRELDEAMVRVLS